MSNSYCGKKCNTCVYKNELGCSSCKNGPGRQWTDECEVALCCQNMGYDSCVDCVHVKSCEKLMRKAYIPECRLQNRTDKTKKNKRLYFRSKYLGKWLFVLFWILILSQIFAVFINDFFAEKIYVLYIGAIIANLILGISHSFVLIKLARQSTYYKKAGYCFLFCTIVQAISRMVVSASIIGIILSFIFLAFGALSGIIMLIGTYFEFEAHSQVVLNIDYGLSDKWKKLWGWYIGLNVAYICSTIITKIPLFLYILIGTIVVDIVRIVFVYRSANLFKNYSISMVKER